MNLELKFKKLVNRFSFDTRDYWELRYKDGGNSGVGSYGAFCEGKAKLLNDLIQKYNIQQITELGCGDGNQLQYYNFPKYLGLDVSKTAIKKCIEKYHSDLSKSFLHYDPQFFKNSGEVFNSQAAISIEVIFHLVEDHIFEAYMRDLFTMAQEYVIIFSSDTNENHGSAKHVRHHKFTDFISKNFSNWSLIEQIPLNIDGEHFNDWYLYKKS